MFPARFSDHHDFAEIPQALARNRRPQRKQAFTHQSYSRAAIVKYMLVLVRLVLGVDRHRNGTNLDGSKKGVKKFRRVQKQEQYALFALDTQVAQSVSDAIGPLQQL